MQELPTYNAREHCEGFKDVLEGLYLEMALSGLSMGMLYPLGTALCFQETKSLFPGLGCLLVYFS